MMVLRPVTHADLDDLYRLAQLVGSGMTNLPPDRDALTIKIQNSLDAFSRPISFDDTPGEENYLFVLEDSSNSRVVGCSGIFATVGLQRPFYSYRLLDLPHVSPESRIYKSVPALHMVNQYTGVAEVGVLFLEPDYRKDGNGRLLARARYLFMAQFRERFPDVVIAEMRGVQYAEAKSAFWEAIGAHFFDMEFEEADKASVQSTQFIADLMPKHPIYTCLLPKGAQEVIGVAHEASRPALTLLEKEGFRYEGCVDVFDAGPQVHCLIDQIRTVRESRQARVAKIKEITNGIECLLTNTNCLQYRLCSGLVQQHSDNEVVISPKAAAALGLKVGSELRYVNSQFQKQGSAAKV